MLLGIDRIDNYLFLFEGKKVGLLTNPTGINKEFKSSIDVLKEKTNLTTLYGPEHGVRANAQAGCKVDSYIDEKSGCQVYSLYGKSKRPTKEMLDNIDIMCVDVLDVGSRYYTFIWTLAYIMEECKKYNKKVVVFDRPNPVNCEDVEGNLLDINYRSFVGYYPIVQRHGMTIGEIAYMFNNEYINCDLEIIKMEGYERWFSYEDTGLLWVSPSPNYPTINTGYVYNCTCIFEGTNIEEGRGTTLPFQNIGAPFINPYELSDKLNSMNLDGVYFRPLYFTPTFSKYANTTCGGVEVHILDRKKFKAVKTGFTMLYVIRNLYPNNFKISKPYKEGMKTLFEYLVGCDYLFENKYPLEKQYELIEKDTEEFKKIREKYLLY